MTERLRAFAVLAGLVVSGVDCAAEHAQGRPVVVEPAEDAPVATPPAPAPASAGAGAPGAPGTDPPSMARPIPTMRTKAYPFPVATLPGFEMMPDGGSRVFVEVTKKVDVEERRAARVLTYVLKGARIVYRNNENPLVTVHFNTPMTVARLRPSGRDAILSVDLRADTAPTWKMVVDSDDSSATLEIVFPKGSFLPAGEGEAALPATAVPPGPPPGPPSGTPHADSGRSGGHAWRGSNASRGASGNPTPVGPAVGPAGN